VADIDLERILNEPHYGFNLQYFIGDVEDFLDFSESNIEWQHRAELQRIRRETATGDWPDGYREHLEGNAEYRFTVSLPLRVRYAAVVALVTSVEWYVGHLVKLLQVPLPEKPKGLKRNDTVHALFELQQRTSVGAQETIRDYEALVHLRNCIAHAAGIEEDYEHKDQLAVSIGGLAGVSLENWHYLGKHIAISKGALNPFIRSIGDLVIALEKAAHEQRLLQSDT
jgi:hypothetical protein